MGLTDATRVAADDREPTTRPRVTLSFSQSLDGSISALRGRPLNLSGRESLELTHRMRAGHDAILVGIGTVLADDPQLTVRLVSGQSPRPVILDSRLRTPTNSAFLNNKEQTPLIATVRPVDPSRRSALESAGAEILPMPEDGQGRVDLASLLRSFDMIGIKSLMVEGGAAVITSFLLGRWVDRLTVTIVPALVGGTRSVEQLLALDTEGQSGEGDYSIGRFPRLKGLEVERAGQDLILSGEIRWGNS